MPLDVEVGQAEKPQDVTRWNSWGNMRQCAPYIHGELMVNALFLVLMATSFMI